MDLPSIQSTESLFYLFVHCVEVKICKSGGAKSVFKSFRFPVDYTYIRVHIRMDQLLTTGKSVTDPNGNKSEAL